MLVVLPTIATFDVGASYNFKFWRHTIKSRVIVKDVFNHDRFYVLPQAANGGFLQITQRVPTRLWTFTTGVDF